MAGGIGYNFTADAKARSSEVNANFEFFRGHYLPITQSGTWANTTGVYNLGSQTRKWKSLFLANTIYFADTTTAFDGATNAVKHAMVNQKDGLRVFDDFLGFAISNFWKVPASNPPAIPAPGMENGVIRFPAPYTTYLSTIDGVTDNRPWRLSASPANTITFETRLRMLTAGGYATAYSIGLVDALGAGVNNGVFFYKSGTAANWWCRTQSGGAATDTDSGVAQSTTYQKLKIVASATSVAFYIDDVLKATHTTNIPTVKLGLSVYFITLSTYAYDVDYVDCVSSTRV